MEPVIDVFAHRRLLRDPARRRARDAARQRQHSQDQLRANRASCSSCCTRRGYDVGRIDGVLGLKSRSAIREMQIKFGLPADSWPTEELMQRLRAGR